MELSESCRMLSATGISAELAGKIAEQNKIRELQRHQNKEKMQQQAVARNIQDH
jgi:hypothetical protein